MTRRGIILFAALGLIWGIPYLFIKIAVAELTPEFLVLARAGLAALILLPIAASRGALRPVLKHWKPLLAFAFVEMLLPWFFLNSAEVNLPSSTTGLLLSAVPLVAVGVALAFGRRDRITAINWVGIATGMLGVAAIVGLDLGDAQLLAHYQQWRSIDTLSVSVATDTLNRLFAIKGKPARAVRRFGLGAVHKIAPLKSLFMAEARGESGTVPKLLQGMTI